VPISSTLVRRLARSAWVISATTCGWLKVWPWPMGIAMFS